MNDIIGILINPEEKNITSVNINSEKIAEILGCTLLSVVARLDNGDMVYANSLAQSGGEKAIQGFYFHSYGYIYGKAIIAGTMPSGKIISAGKETSWVISHVEFSQDPMINWYKAYLLRNGVDMDTMIEVKRENGVQYAPVHGILNILSKLSKKNKDEIKILAEIDSAGGRTPIPLLSHFANKLMEVQ